jgi:hypothetical protein
MQAKDDGCDGAVEMLSPEAEGRFVAKGKNH